MTCESCWNEAYVRAMSDSRKDQYDHYRDILRERGPLPCPPREQAGQWWDETTQKDSRVTP